METPAMMAMATPYAHSRDHYTADDSTTHPTQIDMHSPSLLSVVTLPSVLPYILSMCSNNDLDAIGLVDTESATLCETEWKLRVSARFGSLRFATCHWRKVFKLRSFFLRKVVDTVTARVYLMNTRGETTCFPVGTGTSMMCSRERAIVYNRCERMFDLSLRINRSIQEISALIGMVSVDEARGLLNEHINLMASVASLRSSLMFESELFPVFPAPVLLDANTLLRATYAFKDNRDFMDSATVMMQMWASIDGLIYRPLAPPSILDTTVQGTENDHDETDQLGQPPPATTAAPVDYNVLKLHELSGMTIRIDDNTLRYRLQQQELCVNALVSNSYLLYLFNPLQFRPMDWTYDAVVYVGGARHQLPMQREGVFLNSNTQALRVFLSYGKMPERVDDEDDEFETTERRELGTRGSDDSDPLDIAYSGDTEVFSFLLVATNRVTRETYEIANKATCFALDRTAGSPSVVAPHNNQVSTDPEDHVPSTHPLKPTDRQPPALGHEKHVHLPYDAMVCYSFSEDCRLQYIEFAIGFEALLHRLQVNSFLVS